MRRMKVELLCVLIVATFLYFVIIPSLAQAGTITLNTTETNLNTSVLINGTGFTPSINYSVAFLLENKSSWWDGYKEQWTLPFTNVTTDADGNFSFVWNIPWDWRMSGGKTYIEVGQNLSSAVIWQTQGTNWVATQPTKNGVTGDSDPNGLIFTASSAAAANQGGVEGFFKSNGTLFCRQNMTGVFNFNDITNNGTIVYAVSSQAAAANLWRMNQTNCSQLIGSTTITANALWSVNIAPDKSYLIITSIANVGPYKWNTTVDPPTNVTAFNAYRINSIAYDNCISPDGSKVFIGYANGNVTALNSTTGALIWNRDPPEEELGSAFNFPVYGLDCDADRVYVGRTTVTAPAGVINQGFVEALNTTNGNRVWTIGKTDTFYDNGDVNNIKCDSSYCYAVRSTQTVYAGIAGSVIMQINKTTGNVTWWNWRSWLPTTYNGAYGTGGAHSVLQTLWQDGDVNGNLYPVYTNGWVQRIMKNDVNAQTFDPPLWIRGDTNLWNYVADVTKNIWLSNETPIYNFKHWNYQGFPLDTNVTNLDNAYFRFSEISAFNDFSVTETANGIFIDPVIGQLVPTQRNEVQYFNNEYAAACLNTRYAPALTGWHYQDRWCRYEEIPATLTGYNIGTTINGTFLATTTWSLIKTKFYEDYPITKYYGNDKWAWGVEHNASVNQVLGFAVKFGSDQEDVWSDTQGRAVNWQDYTTNYYIRPYYRADLNRESDMYLFIMSKGDGPPNENFTWSKVDLETQKIANPINITFTSDEIGTFTPGGGTFTNRINITAQEPNLMNRNFEPTEIIFNATGGIRSDCQDVMITNSGDIPIDLWQVDNYTACSINNNVSVWMMLNWTQNETKQLSLYYNGSVVLPTGTTDLTVAAIGGTSCSAGTQEIVVNSTNWYSWTRPAAVAPANEVVNYNFNRPVPATPENLFAAALHYDIKQCYRNTNATGTGVGVSTSDTCSATALPKSRCAQTGMRNNTIFVHLNASTDANGLAAIGGGRGTTTNTLYTEYYFFANTGRVRIRTQLKTSLPIINVTVSKNWPPYYYFSIQSLVPGITSGLNTWVYYSGLYEQMKQPVATYNADRTEVNLSSSPLPLLFTVNYGNINQWGDFNASIERPSTLTDTFWGAGCTVHKMTQSYVYTGGPATQTGYTSEFISCSKNVSSQLPAMNSGGFVNIIPKMQWWGTSYNKWSDPFLVGKFYMMPNAYRPYNRENRFLTPYATNNPYSTSARISSYIIPRCPEKEYGYNGYQEFLNDLDNMLANTSLRVTTSTQNIPCAAEIIKWTDNRGSDGTQIIFARNLTVIVGEAHSAGEPTPSNTFAAGEYTYQADGALDYTFAQKGSATAGQLGKWYFTYTPYNYTIHAFATSGNPQFMNTPYSTADSYKIRYNWAPESPYNKVVFDESALWNRASQNFSYYRNPCWLGRYDDAFGGTETLNTPRPPGWQHLEWGGGSTYAYSTTCPHNTYNMEIQDVFRPGWSSKVPTSTDVAAYNEFLIFGRQNKGGTGTPPGGTDTYYVAGHSSLSDGPHSDDYLSVLTSYTDLDQGVKNPNQEPWYCIISRHTNKSFCVMESSLSSLIYNQGPGVLTQTQPFSPYWQGVKETTVFRNYFNLRFGDTSAWNVPWEHYVEVNVYPTLAKNEILFSNLLLTTNDPDDYTKFFQQQFPFAQNTINQNQFLLKDWENSAFISFDKTTRQYSPGQWMNITGLFIQNGTVFANQNFNLQIYKNDGTYITTYATSTNSSGYFTWNYQLPTTLTSGLYYVYVNYNNGAFTDSTSFVVTAYNVQTATDKSSYTPGDAVSISHTITDYVSGSAADPVTIQEEIIDSSGTTVKCSRYPATTPTCTNLLTKSAIGSYSDSLTLDPSVPTGSATIRVTTTDANGVYAYYYSGFGIAKPAGTIIESPSNTIVGSAFTSNITTQNTGYEQASKNIELTVPTSCGYITSVTNSTGGAITYSTQDLSSACKVYWTITLAAKTTTWYKVQATLQTSSGGANPGIEIDTPLIVNTSTNFGIVAFVRNNNGQLTNCDANAQLILNDSISGASVLNGVAMTNTAAGQYNYTTSVSTQSTFLAQVSCSIGSTTYISNPKIISSQNVPTTGGAGGGLTAEQNQTLYDVWNALQCNGGYGNWFICKNILNTSYDIGSAVWNYGARSLTTDIGNVVWDYATRNLTYNPQNLTAEEIWNYATRNLTYYNTTGIAGDVWIYDTRNLTFYNTTSADNIQSCLKDSSCVAWWINISLNQINSTINNININIDYNQIAAFVWNYTSRNLTYYNQSVAENIQACLRDSQCSDWWINTTLSQTNNTINNINSTASQIKSDTQTLLNQFDCASENEMCTRLQNILNNATDIQSRVYSLNATQIPDLQTSANNIYTDTQYVRNNMATNNSIGDLNSSILWLIDNSVTQNIFENNMSDIRSRLSNINSSIQNIKTSIDCSIPSNSILCTYLDNVNSTANIISSNIATYSQVQNLQNDVTYMKNNMITQTMFEGNMTDNINRLANMNSTIVSTYNYLTDTIKTSLDYINQTTMTIRDEADANNIAIQNKLDDLQNNVTWLKTNVAISDAMNSNFTDLRSRLNDINSTIADIKISVDCPVSSNSDLCTYLNNINNTVNSISFNMATQNYLQQVALNVSYIKDNMATYSQAQNIQSNISWIKDNVATQDALINNFTETFSRLTNINDTLWNVQNDLNATNQSLAQQIQNVQNDVTWLNGNVASSEEINGNFTETFNKLSNINSTVFDVENYLIGTITDRLTEMNITTQDAKNYLYLNATDRLTEINETTQKTYAYLLANVSNITANSNNTEILNKLDDVQNNLTFIKNNMFYQGNATGSLLVDYLSTVYVEPGNRAEFWTVTKDLLGNQHTVSSAACEVRQRGNFEVDANVSILTGGVYAYWNIPSGQKSGDYYWNCTFTGSILNLQVPFFVSGTTQQINQTISQNFNVRMSDFGTIAAGDQYLARIYITDYLGQPLNADFPPRITLYDPLRNIIVDNISMTLSETGIYTYNFTTASSQTAGQWEAVSKVTVYGITQTLNDFWELASSPAQVKINSISDNTIPTIGADVTITNEGGTAQEYQYEYCIVANQTNQCGGGDDIDYASGAKLIQAGQSWNTVLTLDKVNQVGDYWFKVVVYFGTQKSGASKAFTAIEALAPAPTAPAVPTGAAVGVPVATTTTTTIPPVVISESKTFSIPAGSSTKIEIARSDDLKIQQIEIKVKNDVINAQIVVKEGSLPAGAPVVIAIDKGATYKYLEITKSNITDADISNVKIRFKVDRSWVTENNINFTTIALYKYEYGSWTKLLTTFLNSDSNYYYFEVESTSLSIYAIAGEKKPIEVEVEQSIKNYESSIEKLFIETEKATKDGKNTSFVIENLNRAKAELEIAKQLYNSGDYAGVKEQLENVRKFVEQATVQLAQIVGLRIIFIPIPFPRPEIVVSLVGAIGLPAFYYYRQKKENEKYRKSIRKVIQIIKIGGRDKNG